MYQLASGAVEWFHPATAVLLRGVISSLSECLEESAVARETPAGALNWIVHKTAREYKQEVGGRLYVFAISARDVAAVDCERLTCHEGGGVGAQP